MLLVAVHSLLPSRNMNKIVLLLLLACGWCRGCAASPQLFADWKACSRASAAFSIQGVDLQPDVVPQGGTVRLAIDVLNTQPQVTAGSATVKVYYYGWWVLTASGTMCEGPPSQLVQRDGSRGTVIAVHRRLLKSSSSSSTSSTSTSTSSWWSGTKARLWLRDDTCVLPGGPLQLHHNADLPSIAPRGNYRMQLSASDANNGQELFCLDVWFKVA